MRVILDTNVLLSAFIRVDSKPYKLIEAWIDGRFELVSSAEQLEEPARASRYPKLRRYLEPAEIGWLTNRIRDRALRVERLPKVDVAGDPADNFLLAMAQKSAAHYLVTGDRSGLLAIRQHGSTRLVSVSHMVSTLKLR